MTFQDVYHAFRCYAELFREPDGTFLLGVRLKIVHTDDVCSCTEQILSAEGPFPGLSDDLFRYAALFHDVARFEQFRKFKTFRDAVSFDHGNRSAEIIVEQGFLNHLPANDRAGVANAVRVHNKLMIPADFPERYLPVAQMVRDADKLAIFKLVIEFFNGRGDYAKDPSVQLDLPDTPGFSDGVLDRVAAGKPVPYTELKCVNDFKLTLFNWNRELYYKESARIALKEKVFESLRALLPENRTVDRILADTLASLNHRGA